MLWLYRYLRGYITILLCGDYAEKVLNLCVSHRISIWDSRLCKEGIKTNIYVSDIKRLRKTVRKSGVKVKIIKKAGLPFKLEKNKKRCGFFIGLIIMLVFLNIMSGFIWQIDIVGNSKVKTAEILADCKKIGIYEGIRAGSINSKALREKLLLSSDKLAWASLNIEGSRLTVNVTEIDDSKKSPEPCNLVASADGIIKKIDITVGNCLVKVGDTVKKGDVLVSGISERADSTYFVHSQGTVIAETTRVFSSEGKYQKRIKEPTGEVKTKYAVEFFTIKLPLFLGSEIKEYESELQIKEASLWGKSLPLRLYQKDFIFYNNKTVTVSDQNLESELKEDIIKRIENESFENYKISDFSIEKSDEGMTVKTLVTATENIAVKESLIINENG